MARRVRHRMIVDILEIVIHDSVDWNVNNVNWHDHRFMCDSSWSLFGRIHRHGSLERAWRNVPDAVCCKMDHALAVRVWQRCAGHIGNVHSRFAGFDVPRLRDAGNRAARACQSDAEQVLCELCIWEVRREVAAHVDFASFNEKVPGVDIVLELFEDRCQFPDNRWVSK